MVRVSQDLPDPTVRDTTLPGPSGPGGSPGAGSPGPTADVSVRVAWADDAEAVAAVQVRAWRESYADLLPPEVLASLDPAGMAAAWRQALAAPGDARQRVLVALARNLVTGFVVTGPTTDPDHDPVATGELSDLTVDPHQRGAGHGSRLLTAAAETLAADRFSTAVSWLPVGDDAQRAFLTGAGWAPDGAHRTLDLLGDGTTVVKQVRLHTRLVD
ncbi:MAG: GCN5-related N-acetyltransferase [Marmoricola sp.]|nr:GCN5-related N-acetyltransferase [Marmoricola sp.]